MLDAASISVHFGAVAAVDGVSLTVADDEVVGLVGPNGSGKSTFLNALTGVVAARGRATIDGRELRFGRPRQIHELGISRVFQAPQTFAALSVLENVLLAHPARRGAGLAGSWPIRPLMLRSERVRSQDSVEALAQVGLDELALAPAASLAYGQRRLLELARAVISRPKLLLLDEPSAGLNASETSELGERLRQLKAAGMALLLVDHKIDFVDSLADRIIVLESGQIVAEGPPTQIWTDPRVRDAYLGKAHA